MATKGNSEGYVYFLTNKGNVGMLNIVNMM